MKFPLACIGLAVLFGVTHLPDWPAYTPATERYLSIRNPTRVETVRADALDPFSAR